MAMWYSVLVKNFIVPVLHLKIGLLNAVLKNFIFWVHSDVEKLSTGEKVDRNTLVTLKQVIAKIRQNRQMWDFNYCVML